MILELCIWGDCNIVARFNVEDSLWRWGPFLDLVALLRDKEKALGAFVLAGQKAQEFWKQGRKPIPRTVFERDGLNPALITAAVCVRVRDDGSEAEASDASAPFVLLRGSETHFAWLVKRQESGSKGGKKSGKARRENKEKKPKQSQANESKTNPPSPSPSPSQEGNPSQNPSGSSKGEGAEAPPALPVIQNPVGFFISRYVTAYQKAHGEKARPDLRGKVQGEIRRFVEETPLERACALIETYCAMQDAWFITKAHDFGTFIANLSKVGVALDTGKVITKTEANQADRSSALQQQLKRIQEGKA